MSFGDSLISTCSMFHLFVAQQLNAMLNVLNAGTILILM